MISTRDIQIWGLSSAVYGRDSGLSLGRVLGILSGFRRVGLENMGAKHTNTFLGGSLLQFFATIHPKTLVSNSKAKP